MDQLMNSPEQGAQTQRRSVDPVPGGDLTQEDYEEARAALIKASQRGPEEHLVVHTLTADRRGRGGQVERLDEKAFLSRDAITSIVQSVLEQYYEEIEPEIQKVQEQPADDRRAIGVENPVTDTFLASVAGDRRIWGRFEETDPIILSDPLWVNSAIAMLWRRFRNKHAFNERPARPYTIRDDARLVLVGDWGTGLGRAQKISAEIKKVLEEGKAEGREQHVIHLGDVYYSGWEYEYRKRFLPYWPVQSEEDRQRVTSWACNGNHDMYSGGHAYFDYLLADERFALQEQSSYFSFENQHWQILGLDTAWDDHALKDPQATWVEQKLRDFPDRKTMLLSHHQLFSVYEELGTTKLEEKLRGALDTDRIDAWFWGHEHRCVLYEPYKRVRFARCLGNGGVPVYRDEEPLKEPGVWQLQGYLPDPDGFEEWALFGFAVLDFQGPAIRVRYIDENGSPQKEEPIE